MKRSSENLPSTIDDVVAQMIYGNQRKPPGDENCPYQKLLLKKEDIEIPGIWIGLDPLSKAMALKWFFPNVSGPFKLPEEKPTPPHLILGYDAFKYKEIMELSEQHPEAVIKYGFFSKDILGQAELITKTVEKFEKRMQPPTYDEKIVIQLAKCDVWFPAFLELGPSYMSPDTVTGAEEAKIFFPITYDIPEDIILEIKKKPKKKTKSKFIAVVEAHEDKLLHIDKESSTGPSANEEQVSEENADGHESIEDKAAEGEDEEAEDGIDETDKATSPMIDERDEENKTE